MPRPQVPTRDAPPAVLAERLGFLLKHAYQAYHSIQDPALASLGLDGRLLAVLTLVDAEGPALQQRLAERLRVDRTTMVALVDALEHAGFVERRRDPADRRGHQIGITQKGTLALRRAGAAILDVEQDFLEGLSDSEQRQLRRLLAKLAHIRAPFTRPVSASSPSRHIAGTPQ